MNPVREIAIYVEGGGDTAQQKAELRQGFEGLLREQKELAQRMGIGWKLICCGGRTMAYNKFCNAVNTNPHAINVLLVDSEDPMTPLTHQKINDAQAVVQHLAARDRWDLSQVHAERIHLMVQCMEAWLVADPDTLATFYGQHFRQNLLPKNTNLENEPKQDIYNKLEQASSDHGKHKILKGRYGKIKHASQLLKMVDPSKIEARCPRFKLLREWLNETIKNI